MAPELGLGDRRADAAHFSSPHASPIVTPRDRWLCAGWGPRGDRGALPTSGWRARDRGTRRDSGAAQERRRARCAGGGDACGSLGTRVTCPNAIGRDGQSGHWDWDPGGARNQARAGPGRASRPRPSLGSARWARGPVAVPGVLGALGASAGLRVERKPESSGGPRTGGDWHLIVPEWRGGRSPAIGWGRLSPRPCPGREGAAERGLSGEHAPSSEACAVQRAPVSPVAPQAEGAPACLPVCCPMSPGPRARGTAQAGPPPRTDTDSVLAASPVSAGQFLK